VNVIGDSADEGSDQLPTTFAVRFSVFPFFSKLLLLRLRCIEMAAFHRRQLTLVNMGRLYFWDEAPAELDKMV